MSLEVFIAVSAGYCICEMYSSIFLLSKKIRMYFLVKRMCGCSPHLKQLLFTTRFFALTKFSMLDGSHMDVHRICDLAVVHLFKCIFNLGPRVPFTRHCS